LVALAKFTFSSLALLSVALAIHDEGDNSQFFSSHSSHLSTIMAAVSSTPSGSNNPASPVDLSTIPISPEGGNNADENRKPKAEGADEQITVFHDKDNFNVKHPLMHKWTLWFTKPPSGKVCFAALEDLSAM
jgi:hypothetical protein